MIVLPGRSSSWTAGGLPTDAEIEAIISADANSGMWVPRMFGQFIADPGFDSGVSNWSEVGDCTLTHTGSAMSVAHGSGSAPGAVYTAGWSTVIGRMYQVRATVLSGSGAWVVKSDSAATYNSNQANIAANQGAGTYLGWFVATATTTYLHCIVTTGTVVFDDVTVTEAGSGYGQPSSTGDAPIIETNGDGDVVGTFSEFDYVRSSITPTSTYSIFARLRTSDTPGVFCTDNGGANYVGAWLSGSTQSPHGNAGSPTYYIDGGAALSSPTRGDLDGYVNTGAGTEAWVTVRIKSINASAWTNFDFFKYGSGYGLTGEIAGLIWCPDTLGDTNETDFLAYLEDLAA